MRAAGLAVILVTLLVVSAAAAHDASGPVTLALIRGGVDGFAQDGERIVWVEEFRDCARVRMRRLGSSETSSLVRKKGAGCDDESYGVYGGVQWRMALAGERALWGYVYVSNNSHHVSLYTATRQDRVERSVAGVESEAGFADPDAFEPVPLAGDGSTLVFADNGDRDGLAYLVGRRARPVPASEGTRAVAAAGRSFALARVVPGGCACTAEPAWSPDASTIAFLSQRGAGGLDDRSRSDLYALDVATGRVRAVATGERNVSGVDWSPDGRRLAFSEDGKVVLANPDGSGRRVLTSGWDAQWSPDGSLIAFERDEKSALGSAAFVVAASGGRPRRLTAGYGIDWTPYGQRILVYRDDVEPAVVYVVGVDGSGLRRLVDADSPGRVSPDGHWFAYWLGGSFRVVSLVDAESRVLYKDPRPYSSGSRASWSADSSRIAFEFEGRIMVVALGRGAAISLAAGREPAWSPRGDDIAYVLPGKEEGFGLIPRGGELGLVAADGSGRRVLTRSDPVPTGYPVEVRSAPSGRLRSTFDAPAEVVAVALTPTRVGLLARGKGHLRLELRRRDGSVVGSARLPARTAHELCMSGRWAIFRIGRVIKALDVRRRQALVLATSREATVIGLSVDGRRVAWAEQGDRRSTIRAVQLPR